MLNGYTLEMTAKDRKALDDAAPYIAQGTQISITFLPNEAIEDRIAAAVHVRELGFEPMPHLSARRIESKAELNAMVSNLTQKAAVERMFLIAGDPPNPQGPFEDSLSLLRTNIFENNGIKTIGIAGHPEGHPVMNNVQLWDVMNQKVEMIHNANMSPMIVTQFAFDPEVFTKWLGELRERGVDIPVSLGIPGPAGIKRLMKYAAFCGVGASTSVLKKYGISLGKLMGKAGPDKLVTELMREIKTNVNAGEVNLHFYPFGGMLPTVRWIADFAARENIQLGEKA